MGKYFDIDKFEVPKELEGKINEKISSSIHELYDTVKNSSLQYNKKPLNEESDFNDLFENILLEAFEDSDTRMKCKALFEIFLSGISTKDSNMIGAIKLLLTAIRCIGSKVNVDVYDVLNEYNRWIKSTMIKPTVVGTISKCNFLGTPIEVDKNDKLANSTDNQFNVKALANTRDDDKINNKGYVVCQNARKKFEQKAIPIILEDEKIIKKINNYKKDKLDNGMSVTDEDAKNYVLALNSTRNKIKEKGKELYNQWFANDYGKLMTRYKQDMNYISSNPHKLKYDFD